MATSLSQYDPVLKELYPDPSRFIKLAYKREPFLSIVRRTTKGVGKQYQIPVQASNVPNASHTASVSFSSLSSNATYGEFVVTRAKGFNRCILDGETLLASEQGGAIIDHLKTQTESTLIGLGQQLARDMYGNYGGYSARLSSSSGVGTTLTLENEEDAVNFQYGEVIQLASTDGTSGAVRSGTATITGRDPDAGTLTFDSAVSGSISGAAASDYVFKQGDFGLSIHGLRSWIPSTAPTSGDSHFGLDRSADTLIYAGSRIDGSGGDAIEDILQDACARAMLYGAYPDTAFMNPVQWQVLSKNLQSQKRYGKIMGSGVLSSVGFPAVALDSPAGELKIVIDHRCPPADIFVLQLDTWELRTMGTAPRFLDRDGMVQRVSGEDSYEVRCGWYGQLVCHAPSKNLRIHSLPVEAR